MPSEQVFTELLEEKDLGAPTLDFHMIDDWKDIQDKTQRKTVQNRLAQRKRRAKLRADSLPQRQRAVGQQCEQLDGSTESRVRDGEQETPENIGPFIPNTENDAKKGVRLQLRLSGVENDGHCNPPIQSATVDAQPSKQVTVAAYLYNATTSGLLEHQFICLSQYSLFRAYVQNAGVLGMDFTFFANDDSISPWNINNPIMEMVAPPQSLRPTTRQLCTFHHPYLDVIASASLRDNILIATLSDDQEDQLCMDLHANGSITVWGSQPWSSMGWEVSQDFADRWGWILDDETIRCSNFWRVERGEPPLLVQML